MRSARPRSVVWAMMALASVGAVSAQPVPVTGQVVLANGGKARKSRDFSNVVVWLTPINSLRGDDPVPLAPQKVRILQARKRFDPHVMVVPVGSVVEFPNDDPVFHNVFSLFNGKRFDLGLYEAGTTREVRFDRPGVCYVFCNIHPEMSAVVLALKTPYYGISRRSGEVTIREVPHGKYLLQVWHERALPEVLKGLSREVKVSDDSLPFGPLQVSETTDLKFAHKNKYGREYDRPTPSSPLYEQP